MSSRISLRWRKNSARNCAQSARLCLEFQLYDLISQAGFETGTRWVAFYSFMSQLGMAAQAIDIVYQLNASEGFRSVDSTSMARRRSNRFLLARTGRQIVTLKKLSITIV